MGNPILDALDKAFAAESTRPPEPILASRDTIVPLAVYLYGEDSPHVADAEDTRASLLRVQFRAVTDLEGAAPEEEGVKR